jgi:hypothetical protein
LLCDRWNQRYKRSITSDMARVLKRLAEIEAKTPGRFVHVYDELGVKGGDYGKLRIWGLMRPTVRAATGVSSLAGLSS